MTCDISIHFKVISYGKYSCYTDVILMSFDCVCVCVDASFILLGVPKWMLKRSTSKSLHGHFAWLIAHVLLEGTINCWVHLLSIPAYSSILNCGIQSFEATAMSLQPPASFKFQISRCWDAISTPRSQQRTRLRVHVPDNFFHWKFKFQRSCFEGKLLVFNVVKHSETKKHICLEDSPRSRPSLWSLFPASPRKAHKQKDEVEP